MTSRKIWPRCMAVGKFDKHSQTSCKGPYICNMEILINHTANAEKCPSLLTEIR
jgi:hypothetical protein